MSIHIQERAEQLHILTVEYGELLRKKEKWEESQRVRSLVNTELNRQISHKVEDIRSMASRIETIAMNPLDTWV